MQVNKCTHTHTHSHGNKNSSRDENEDGNEDGIGEGVGEANKHKKQQNSCRRDKGNGGDLVGGKRKNVVKKVFVQ